MIKDKNITIIGSGKMGDIILSGLLNAGTVKNSRVTATDHSEQRLDYISKKHLVNTSLNNSEAVSSADIVILCIKPQNAVTVLTEISESFKDGALLISIMAGVTIQKIESLVPYNISVIRAMPNTPTQVNAGMTAISGGTKTTVFEMDLAKSLFSSIGDTIELEEKHVDAVTGLSASGPAFIYIVIEALADGGVKCGLPRDVAIRLASQMTLGSAKMVLDTGKHPAILKDDVTTPAGCTTDGILALEEGGVRVTLIKAVSEATRRAKELG